MIHDDTPTTKRMRNIRLVLNSRQNRDGKRENRKHETAVNWEF